MFDIGFLELLIIGVVGLLVLGPERLPKAARTVGLWIGKIKRTVAGMQREINAQLEAEELRQKLDEQQKKLNTGLDKVRRDVESYAEPPTSGANKTDGQQSSPSGTIAHAGKEGEHENPAATTAASLDQAAHEPTEPSRPTNDVASTADDKDSTPR